MKSMSLFALSTGFALTAGMLVSASALNTTSPNSVGSTMQIHSATAVESGAMQIAREKEPKDDRGKDKKDHDPAKHKLFASGGKPCQIYYGCVPTAPAPPKGGKGGKGGADNPTPHKLAPDSSTVQIAREKQPGDDRGRDQRDRDGRDHDKRDDHHRRGRGNNLVETAA